MKTIAVVNQKGGCGKTTVSINLASALAEMGKKILLVDMDPQSHCAVGLAVPEEQIEENIYDVLIESTSNNKPVKLTDILWQISDKLELAPSGIDLSALEQQMAGIPNRENRLKEILDSVRDRFDITVIDCPPAVGLLTFNALRAATDVIVPVEPGYFSLHGLSKQLETLNVLSEQCKQKVNVRVLTSMYDVRTKMAREILAELRTHFGDKMFKTVINFNTKIKEAASFGQPIGEYDPSSKGHEDFKELTRELTGKEPQTQHKQMVNSLAQQLASIKHTAEELLNSSGTANIHDIKKQARETARPAQAEAKASAGQQRQSAEEKAPSSANKFESLKFNKKETKTGKEPPIKSEFSVDLPNFKQLSGSYSNRSTTAAGPFSSEKPSATPKSTTNTLPKFDKPPKTKIHFEESERLSSAKYCPSQVTELPSIKSEMTNTKIEIPKLTSPGEHKQQVQNSGNKQAAAAETASKNKGLDKIELPPIKPLKSLQNNELPLNSKSSLSRNSSEIGLDSKLSDFYGVSQMQDAVVFVTSSPNAKDVQIAADFNNWQPDKNSMEKVGESGVWQTKIKLPAGKYRYRLVVDGNWKHDPFNQEREVNPFGGYNSVLEVK